MKKIINCQLLRVVVLLVTVLSFYGAFAYDIEQGGLFYTLDLTNMTATLDSCDVSLYDNVSVANSITFKNRTFSVVKVNTGAFKDCARLSSVTIFNGIEISDSMFVGCRALQKISLPDEINAIPNGLCIDCANLTEIVIPNSVRIIGDNAFNGCESLAEIDIPNGVQVIGNSTFMGCSKLQQIVIPNSVIEIGKLAFAKSGLKNISMPSGLTKIEDAVFAKTDIESISIPSSVTSIGNSAFYDSKLRQINLPDGLLKIGATSFSKTNIEEIVIPNGVKRIPGATFKDCTSLKKVKLSDNCSYIGGLAFYNCSSLKTMELPDDIDSIWDIRMSDDYDKYSFYIFRDIDYVSTNGTFANCINLESIHLPSNLKVLCENTFYNCEKLKYLSIPDKISKLYTTCFSGNCGIEEIDMSPTNLGTKFEDYSEHYWPANLKRLAVSLEQTEKNENSSRPENCFYPKLEKLKVMPNAKNIEVSIPYFEYSSLIGYYPILADSLYLYDSPTSINRHKEGAPGNYSYLYMGRNLKLDNIDCNVEDFVGNSLSTLIIGPQVTRCNMSKANMLQSIESKIENPLVLQPSFPKSVYINATLIVPAGTKSAYEQAPGWKDFFDIQEADVATGISSTSIKEKTEVSEIYNIKGQKLAKPERGINIIKRADGSSTKVIIK